MAPKLRLLDTETRVVHRIACGVAIQAARTGDDRPACEWLRDAGGYACRRCALWIGPETYRWQELARRFGDLDESDPAALSEPLAAVCAEIESLATDLIEAGEDPARATTIAGGTLLLVARGTSRKIR